MTISNKCKSQNFFFLRQSKLPGGALKARDTLQGRSMRRQTNRFSLLKLFLLCNPKIDCEWRKRREGKVGTLVYVCPLKRASKLPRISQVKQKKEREHNWSQKVPVVEEVLGTASQKSVHVCYTYCRLLLAPESEKRELNYVNVQTAWSSMNERSTTTRRFIRMLCTLVSHFRGWLVKCKKTSFKRLTTEVFFSL